MALLILVGDTGPGGDRHSPQLIRGLLGIIIGMLGLFLYGIGHYKIDHNKMSKADHLKVTLPIMVGTLVLIVLAIYIHD